MSLCCGTIDHVNVIGACCDQGAKQLLPEASRGPSMKAIIDCRRRTVARGAILPAATALQHMHDPADHPPIINPARTRTVLRKQWIDRRPLRVAQPKLVRHRQAPCRELESDLQLNLNSLIEFGA